MKTPEIPKGLHAVYTYDHTRGWTCCSLVNRDFKVVSAGLARYNPKDATDPLHPFDPEFGCGIALGRAVKKYMRDSNTKKSFDYGEELHRIIEEKKALYAPLPLGA